MVLNDTEFTADKRSILNGLIVKHMFILEPHSWSFLSTFETESNLSDAYKKAYVVFFIRLFRGRKNSHWENRLSRWDNFICFHFLVNEFHSQIKKVYTQNEPKFTRIEHFLNHRESQWVSGSCYCDK